MNSIERWSVAILSAAVITSPALVAGCSGRVQIYDSYHRDYHPWNHHEAVLYSQWEDQNHHAHVEFNARTPEEQHAYWDWRPSH